MKLFLDSAETDEISEGLAQWDIDGITTNPKHIATAGKPRLTVLQEIADLVQGTDKPVSVEVDPHLQRWEEMVEAARKLAAMSPNFVIKLGASEDAYRAVRELAAEGIRTNLTLVFSVSQAWHAARSGAAFVSPFVGWKEQHGDDGLDLIADIATMLAMHSYPTEIIAAAIRNPRQIGHVAVAGAHCVTAGMAVYRDSFRSPYTDMGHEIFGRAWDATPPD
jgi:transaldolase